jgi:Secretion system C-terminal sorting domain
MKKLIILLILFCANSILAQNKEWHVKPYADNYYTTGTGLSLAAAWNIQYALSGAGGQIHAGDIIWLHGDQKSTYIGTPTAAAIYKGHFKSTLSGQLVGAEEKYITVASYPGEWAVIDGNIHNNPYTLSPIIGGNNSQLILEVIGGYVHFDNFEITCIGDFSRIHEKRTQTAETNSPPCPDLLAYNFHRYDGISHGLDLSETTAIKNKFTNLVIRNIPGVAIASWKFTLDSEIYGNLLYNNGKIDVIGVGCGPSISLESVVAYGLYADKVFPNPATPGQNFPVNCNGKSASIYTQNAHATLKRNIKNNVFLNCYDSGLIIWSTNDYASSLDYVKNFDVIKNVFINNGAPARDDTSNMLVSTDFNPITKINIDSNIFYLNSKSNYISGILVNNAIDDINIANNYIFNSTAGMEFRNTNHKIHFHHNFYAGKRIKLLSSIENYKLSGNEWSMDYNTYFTRPGSQNMFYVPLLPFNPGNINSLRGLTLNVINPNLNPPILTNFRSVEEYNDEQHSSRNIFNSSLFPPARTIINQNKYNPNKFYVTIYNPTESSNNVLISFADYGIPIGKHYIIKDVQNYFLPLLNTTYTGGDISFPIPNPTGSNVFESPLPFNTTTFGPAFTFQSLPVHSNRDLNTYEIEFDCPNLAYDLTLQNLTNTTTINYEARNRIQFGTNYISDATATVTATAEKEIKIITGSWIKSGTKFLAKIDKNLCSIMLNEYEEANSLDTNPTGIPASLVSSQDDPIELGTVFRMNLATNDILDFAIFPNPSSGIFNIESLNEHKINKVQITKTDTARKVFDENYNNQTAINVDISRKQKGLYTVQVFFENNTSQSKTIIVK